MSKSSEEVKSITKRLWELEGALRGIAALLQQQSNSPCYSTDELFGLGQSMLIFSEEISIIEDKIRTKFC
jgi:hypothetical protein